MATQSHALPQTPVILLTRPEDQSHRFAAQLRDALGVVKIVISPLMAPRFWQPALPARRFAALVLTSQAGAEAARRISASGQALPSLAYCVADRTAEAARAAGFTAISAKGDADALVALLLKSEVDGPLLHLCGQETRGDVAQKLCNAGTEAMPVICYDQVAQPLSPYARTILCGSAPVLVPLFSPRSAKLFAAEVQSAAGTAPVLIAAISMAVTAALSPWKPAGLQIASEPNGPAMVATIRTLMPGKTSA